MMNSNVSSFVQLGLPSCTNLFELSHYFLLLTSYVSCHFVFMDCSQSVGGINETESHCAINNCTLRVSGTVPTTGLSNPCLDTQRLLCLVMYCSRGGVMETESHRANYVCTLRVSVTVLASSAVNPLTTDCSSGELNETMIASFQLI